VRFQNDKGETHYGDAILNPNGKIESAKLITGDIFQNPSVTNTTHKISKLLAPIFPRSIICIGLNYKMHAQESGLPVPERPVVFYKNISAVQNPGDPIIIPSIAQNPPEVDYECELVVVIGKPCKNVTVANALDYVLGYTCSNDVSARKWQMNRGGGQWNFGKSFDTFCPLGPVITSSSVITDPNNLKLSTTLNGKVLQSSNTSDMIFTVKQIIQFLSQSTTLVPGTVILTGTPQGVGFARNPPIFLSQGDSVTIEIEKIGKLTNPVRNE
jgi:2-keto-4-pentenoate hydratase/2-oxohepta-3-ene-1,7-dioic acid hydratase in catechol pathway